MRRVRGASGSAVASATGLWRKRSASQRGLLLASAGTVLIFTLLLSVIVGFASRSPLAAVRDTVAAGPTASVSEAIGADLAANSAKQDAAMRRVIHSTFRDAPLDIARSVVSDALPLAGAGSRSVVLLPQGSTLASRIRFVSGSAAKLDAGSTDQPLPVAIDEAGARALGARPGDRLRVATDGGTVSVTVVGIWQPINSDALAWEGAQPGTSGSSARLVATPAVIHSLGAELTAQWAIAPNAATVRVSDLPELVHGFSHVVSDASNSHALNSPARLLAGQGGTTIAAMQASLAAVGAVLPVPVAVLVVAALIALILLAMLLAASRENETRLFRARGAGIGTLVRAGLAEVAIIAVAGAIVGSLFGQLWLSLAIGGAIDPLEPLASPLAAAIGAVAVFVGVAAIAAIRASGAPRPESGRVRTAASWSLTVLSIAAAGVTLWRFLEYGIPAAGHQPDPVGVFAPAATLCAFAMAGLLVLAPLSRLAERLSARAPGIRAVLPARQVARNLGVFAAPVALLVLASGAATFAASYSATWSSFVASSSQMVNGSDVRASFTGSAVVNGPQDLIDHQAYAALADVTSAVPVMQTDADVGDSSVSVVGVPATALPGVLKVDPGALDAQRLRTQLRTGANPLEGVPLPAAARGFTLRVLATRSDVPAAAKYAATVYTTVWLADPDGELVPVTLRALPVAQVAGAAAVSLAGAVPRGGPWKVVAVDVDVNAPRLVEDFRFRVASISSSVSSSVSGSPRAVAVPSSQKWSIQSGAYGQSFGDSASKSGSIEVASPLIRGSSSRDSAARLMPQGAAKVPVVISQAVSQAIALRVGDTVKFPGTWASFTGTIAGIVPLVPGVEDGMSAIVDLPAYENAALRSSEDIPTLNQVWVSTGSTAAVARRVATLAGPSATVTTASGDLVNRFLASAVVGAWLGALGCAAFAVVAFAAALAAMTRRRRAEIAVFRSIGLSARQQGVAWRAELIGVVVYAVLFGLVSGVLIALLTIGVLARLSVATAPTALAIPGHVDTLTLAAALLALILALGLVAGGYERAIRGRASRRERDGES